MDGAPKRSRATWTAAAPGLQEPLALAELQVRPELLLAMELPERELRALPEQADWAARLEHLALQERRGAPGVRTLTRHRAEAVLP
jgi:hypothetical protein